MKDDEQPDDDGPKRKRTPMSKEGNRLTAKKIEALIRKKQVGRHHDGHGLVLEIRIGTDGEPRASWMLRYQRGKRERMHGLGPLHTVRLADARERARQARLQLLDGTDPIDAKRSARVQRKLEDARRKTFRQAAEEFLGAREDRWGTVHRGQWRTTLNQYVYPIIGDLPIREIGEDQVVAVLKPIWGTKETAQRLRGRIARVLDYAESHRWREGTNPAS